MLTDAEAKEQIIQITNELFSMGLLTATGGNISALSSLPLGEGGTLGKPSRSGVYIALAILGLVAIGAVAAVLFAGGGDTRGTLSVVSLPPGAEVRIDGVGGTQQTPLKLADVDPRAYLIEGGAAPKDLDTLVVRLRG